MFEEQKEIVGGEADRMLDRLQQKVEKNLYTEDIATATTDFVAKAIKSARNKLNLNTASSTDIANFTNPFEAWKGGSEFTVEGLVKMRSFQGDPDSNISPSLARFCRQMWRTEMVSYVMRKIPKTGRTDKAAVAEKVLAAQIVPGENRTPAKMLASAMYLDNALSSRSERARLAQKMASEGQDGITVDNLSEKFSGFTPTNGVKVLVGGEFITFSKELASSFKFQQVIQDGNRIYGLMENGCKGNLVIIERTGGERREEGPATQFPGAREPAEEPAPAEPPPSPSSPSPAAPSPAPPAPAPAPPAEPAPAPPAPAPAPPAPAPAPTPPPPGTGGPAEVRERADADQRLPDAVVRTMGWLKNESPIKDRISHESGVLLYKVPGVGKYRIIHTYNPNIFMLWVRDPRPNPRNPAMPNLNHRKVPFDVTRSDQLNERYLDGEVKRILRDEFKQSHITGEIETGPAAAMPVSTEILLPNGQRAPESWKVLHPEKRQTFKMITASPMKDDIIFGENVGRLLYYTPSFLRAVVLVLGHNGRFVINFEVSTDKYISIDFNAVNKDDTNPAKIDAKIKEAIQKYHEREKIEQEHRETLEFLKTTPLWGQRIIEEGGRLFYKFEGKDDTKMPVDLAVEKSIRIDTGKELLLFDLTNSDDIDPVKADERIRVKMGVNTAPVDSAAASAEISPETYAWGREFDDKQRDIFSKLQSTQLWTDKRIEITDSGLVYNMKGARDDTYKIDLLRSEEFDFSVDVVAAGFGKREKIYFRLDNPDHVDPVKVDQRIFAKLMELGKKQTA